MSEAPPSLASLRRQSLSRRRPSPASASPGLFDILPETETEALPLQPSTESLSTSSPTFTEAPAAEAGSTPLPQTWTVSGLVRHVRGVVEHGFARVTLEGEISNWRPAGSGHCYFTVKDSNAQLSAVIFRRQASLLRFQPRDGDAVKLHGQLSIYENRGQLQLIVDWIQQAGLGALLAEVQRLKERLRAEGLFDRKRPLPPFPRCIGVITSLRGAALRDIVKVCRRRHAGVRLLIYPAAVQGANCVAEVVAGLRWFNAHPDQAEVVLLARGGGSWEDLHGFDDERIARAIACSALPVITGIGHATDSTVADAVADTCAPTPSAAAEILTAAQHRAEAHLLNLHARLVRAGSFELLRAQQRVDRLGASTVLRRVEDALNRRAQRLDELQFRIHSALNRNLRASINRHTAANTRLARQNPGTLVPANRRRLELLEGRLQHMLIMHAGAAQRRIEAATTRLQVLSPLRVLDRGYALVYGPGGRLLRDPAEAPVGSPIQARLAQGLLTAQVIVPGEPF